jgi:hypothetical protein
MLIVQVHRMRWRDPFSMTLRTAEFIVVAHPSGDLRSNTAYMVETLSDRRWLRSLPHLTPSSLPLTRGNYEQSRR